ncbi:MAG: outer membrane protein assembly factor BamA [bacterium]
MPSAVFLIILAWTVNVFAEAEKSFNRSEDSGGNGREFVYIEESPWYAFGKPEQDIKKWYSRKEEEKEDIRIEKIELEGCDKIPCRTVKAILQQQKTPWYRLEPGDEGYDTFWAKEDRHRIEKFYKSRGFFNVKVTGPEETFSEDGKSVAIRYRIEENRPVHVKRIEIYFTDGVHTDRDPREMRSLLKLQEGDRFEQAPYQESAKAIETYYHNDGFFHVSIKRSAVVSPEELTAVVTYRIRRGIRFKIGEVRIKGYEQTGAEVVRKAIKIKPGDRYRRNEVYADQRRVQRLPIYRTVRLREVPHDEDRVVDIVFMVEEADPRQVKVGVGYGSEEGVRVMAGWKHVNFLGGARELSISARWSALLEKEEIKFTQPNVSSPGDYIQVTGERRVEKEEAYTHEAIALSPLYHFILTPYLWAEVSYRLELERTYDVPSELEAEEEDAAREGLLSVLGGRVHWAELDDRTNPTQGARASLYSEVGGGPVGGDYSYYKLIGEARGYYPVYPPVVAALRWKAGYADPYGDMQQMPLFLRFYTGGTGMVRGFDRYELGPKDADANPIGGSLLWEGSFEIRFPIWKEFGGVVFTDSGWVWPADDEIDPYDVRYASGAGVRYNTPIGPLALDVAFPHQQDEEQLEYRIHFNVGHTF